MKPICSGHLLKPQLDFSCPFLFQLAARFFFVMLLILSTPIWSQDSEKSLKKQDESSQEKDSKGSSKRLNGKDDAGLEIKKIDSKVSALKKEAAYYEKVIDEERNQLIEDIHSMLHIFPISQYNGQILMRLAELYYERETEELNVKLDRYDRMTQEAERKNSKEEIPFPTLRYDSTIAIYSRILNEPTHTEVHDAALFYKSICLLREGHEEAAIADLQLLTVQFPNSEYFSNSQIKIGDYYFAHPSAGNGQGYSLAATAFKKVPAEDPLYAEAVYKLGWCYFQQDNYTEAIATFRHLIEEVKLSFDEQSNKRLMSNPLLRDEAVQFFAVSLSEGGDVEDALKFLQLIGNDNYAAKVLLEMALISNTNSDLAKTGNILNVLLSRFPLSASAPRAMLLLAQNYTKLSQTELAERAQLDFFDTFGRGTKWYESTSDSATLAFVDSQAVKILLNSTENLLRRAQENNDRELFMRVAKSYNRLDEEYPDAPETYGAVWNLAVILDRRLDNPAAAYRTFLRVATEYPDTLYRHEALLNAVATAQKMWESGAARSTIDTGSLAKDTILTDLEKNIITATRAFRKFYPKDPTLGALQLVEANIFFNRGRFADAIPGYTNVLSHSNTRSERDEALSLLARANLGQGNFTEAERWWDSLYQSTDNPKYKKMADDGRVECSYRAAETLVKAGHLIEGAKAFIATARRYPTSSLADIAMFTGAETFEKKEMYTEASSAFTELARLFPSSKYADGALFNAGDDQEKMQKWEAAIEAYEELIRRYPQSPQVKNALFNIALDYEKLKNFDMVAATNERYARLFPDEADVPKLLFEAGKYYLKGQRYQKALDVFQRYYTRYLGTEQEIEARVYTARANQAMGNSRLAKEGFESAIARSDQLKRQGIPITGYFAAEAQYELAGILATDYRQIEIKGLPKTLDAARKQKAEALAKASEAYTKAIEYGTQNSVKSAFTIGLLFEDFAYAYKGQDRVPESNSAKQAVEEMKLLSASGKLLEQALPYYQKSIEFIASIPQDKLDKETLLYRDSVTNKIAEIPWTLSKWTLEAAYLIQNAPIPEDIKAKPLSYYIYRSKVLDKTKPDFLKAIDLLRDFWLAHVDDKSGFGAEARQKYSKENYLLGARYANLAFEMLNNPQKSNQALSEDESEQLSFQMEDLAFEIQDKAIPILEQSAERSAQDQLTDIWSRQVEIVLQRLDPQKHPRASGVTELDITSDHHWWASGTAFSGWESDTSSKATANLFGPVVRSELSGSADMPGTVPDAIWDINASKEVYLRRLISIDDKILSAILDMTVEEDFILYINGKEIFRDKSGGTDALIMKSFNLKPLLHKGVNLIAIQARSSSAKQGFLGRLQLQLQSGSEGKLVTNNRGKSGVVSPRSSESQKAGLPTNDDFNQQLSNEFNTQEKYVKGLYEFRQRTKRASAELRREDAKLNNDQFQLQLVKSKIQNIEAQLKAYQTKLKK